MYDELKSPFSIRWAREAGFGAKSLMRLQRAGLMAESSGRLRLLDVSDALVATTAVGPPVALGLRTGAQWYGWPLLTTPLRIELVVPRRRSPTPWPGARIVRTDLEARDIAICRDVPVTHPMRTAVDLAVHLPGPDALAVLDGACRKQTISLRELTASLHALRRPKAALLADLINPDRASVYESLFFYLMVRAGIPTPQCQFVVRRGDVFLGRADFAWLKQRLIVEIDGFAHHSDREAFHRDRRRQNKMVNARWRVLRFTATDLLLRPHEVIEEVRSALRLRPAKINAAMIMG